MRLFESGRCKARRTFDGEVVRCSKPEGHKSVSHVGWSNHHDPLKPEHVWYGAGDPDYRMPRWQSLAYDVRHWVGVALLLLIAPLALFAGALITILAATS
jgi:hypothetical protein